MKPGASFLTLEGRFLFRKWSIVISIMVPVAFVDTNTRLSPTIQLTNPNPKVVFGDLHLVKTPGLHGQIGGKSTTTKYCDKYGSLLTTKDLLRSSMLQPSRISFNITLSALMQWSTSRPWQRSSMYWSLITAQFCRVKIPPFPDGSVILFWSWTKALWPPIETIDQTVV